jgi:protein-S-isoprenylcysteine O-methyltransferase Ste14
VRKRQAALGSGVFFIVAPCVVAGLLPWWITRWSIHAPHSLFTMFRLALGSVVVIVSLIVLLRAFARFVEEGLGTPAPVAPTERLVVGGEYRYVRNPMYVAVVAAVLGQALLFGSASLLAYAVLSWLVMAAFVRWYEEPVLRSRFGRPYEDYCRFVHAWWPRLRPWSAP